MKTFLTLDMSIILVLSNLAFLPNNNGFNNISAVLKPLFEDIMSFLGVPTSTINAVLNGVTGSVNDDRYDDNARRDITFGLLSDVDFDSCDRSIPTVFSIARASQAIYNESSPYTYSTSLRYRVQYYQLGAPLPQLFYFDAIDTNSSPIYLYIT